ncbi:MAG: hypothetical protein AAGU05_04325, partial [Anaerolineaceae bacterium]
MTYSQELNPEIEKETLPGATSEEMQLDDARRVKVLSPGMLVFKRFIRNRLAVIGFVILFFMFTFSFIGPMFSPYTQTQVFKGIGSMSKDFAGAIYNEELRYTTAAGESFGSSERAQFLLALGKGQETFTVGTDTYYYVKETDNVYRILQLDPIAEALLGKIHPVGDAVVSDELIAAYKAAVDNGQSAFSLEGVTYRITRNKKVSQISTEHDVSLASLNVYDAYQQSNAPTVASYDFKLASTRAFAQQQEVFRAGEQTYSVVYDDGLITVLDGNGAEFAEVSNIIVNPIDQSLFLSVDFKAAVRQAINDQQKKFTYVDTNGSEVEYNIVRVNNTYNVKRETPTELIRTYEAPSAGHPLGLDNNGMDMMTRLMYGGRVSLLVGFVVIFLEVLLGILVGGISGYFGGPVDTALMRFVDLFNSIPFYPIVLIFGSVMDAL